LDGAGDEDALVVVELADGEAAGGGDLREGLPRRGERGQHGREHRHGGGDAPKVERSFFVCFLSLLPSYFYFFTPKHQERRLNGLDLKNKYKRKITFLLL